MREKGGGVGKRAREGGGVEGGGIRGKGGGIRGKGLVMRGEV